MTQPMLFAPPRPPDLRARGIDLRCCDVADLLESMQEPADLVVADPPWKYANNQNGRASEHYALIDLDNIVAHVDAAYRVARTDSYLAVWYTFPFAQVWLRRELAWRYITGGAWAKPGLPGAGYHWRGNAEGVAVYGKGKPRPCTTDVLLSCHVSSRASDGTPGNSGVLHSRKPADWQAGWVRNWCPPGGLVLDLYAGLGSVAEAVLLAGEGRRYVGAEIDPERHAAALALLAGVRA